MKNTNTKKQKNTTNQLENDPFEMVSCVNVQGEWIPLDCVEFLNICEDFQGYDLVTFIHEGAEKQSRVTIKPR
jgi:hypothetical protein